ncbi:SDR family oxidoreductase [Nonomuraea recticatena]|uniref:SDR family oxidoreductase n=1 Tax=Nonomuraea recticatena TaxID=46178 RepID=UPI0036118961
MTILVTGATGTVGRHVVEQLVERGERVRALTRNPGRASFPEGVEIVAGDLTVTASLTAAFEGVTAAHLINCGGTTWRCSRTARRSSTSRSPPGCAG